LIVKLLENDAATLSLLRSNPFPSGPPEYVRARLYRYRFTTWGERRRTRAWWARELVGDYLPPVSLSQHPGLRSRHHGAPLPRPVVRQRRADA